MAYDGERLYTGAKDWKIFIWDVSDPRYVDALPTSTIHLNAIPRGLLRSGNWETTNFLFQGSFFSNHAHG